MRILEIAGSTSIDISAGTITVTAVKLEMLPDLAVTVATPVLTGVTNPLKLVVLLIVATSGVAEVHVTDVVISLIELSEKVPIAVNCSLVPRGILGFSGVIAMDTSIGEGAPDLPPQPATRKRIRKIIGMLLDFIDINSGWD